MDVSADLTELGRTPVTVISSGVKSILDIRKTLEYLVTSVTIRHSVNLSTHKHSSVIFLYTIIIVKNYQEKTGLSGILCYTQIFHQYVYPNLHAHLYCTFTSLFRYYKLMIFLHRKLRVLPWQHTGHPRNSQHFLHHIVASKSHIM